MAQEMAMLHDISRCTGCRACMVACKQWKDLPAEMTPFNGEYQSHKDLSSKTYNLVRMNERVTSDGKFHWDFLKFQCMHCENPACVAGCPEGAISKTEAGPVVVDDDKCIGCGYCTANCPFDVPKIDEQRHKMAKCNMCIDRIEQGMKPSCVQTCPPSAIEFGTKDDMIKLAKERLEFVKKSFPNAQLYGVEPNGVGGTLMMYILTDEPSVYGLPPQPKTPESVNLWKDFVRPIGKVAGAGAILGCAGMFAIGKVIAGNAQHGKEVDKNG